MASTLKRKVFFMNKYIAEINPSHDKVFLKGIGMIKSEWDWCSQRLEHIYLASKNNESQEFSKPYIELVKYVRFKKKFGHIGHI